MARLPAVGRLCPLLTPHGPGGTFALDPPHIVHSPHCHMCSRPGQGRSNPTGDSHCRTASSPSFWYKLGGLPLALASSAGLGEISGSVRKWGKDGKSRAPAPSETELCRGALMVNTGPGARSSGSLAQSGGLWLGTGKAAQRTMQQL